MGYRSEVAIGVDARTYEVICKDYMDGEDNLFRDADITEATNGEVLFYWEWVKWYDCYSDVQYVMRTLDELSDKGYNWYFLRVGEGCGDVEETYSEGYWGCMFEHTPRVVIEW